MTRFWIALRQEVDFVPKHFVRMHCSLAQHLPQKIVDIRHRQKQYEMTCPTDDSQLTLDLPDHPVMKPTIQFSGDVAFAINQLREMGKPVAQGF
jgi:UDP-N-acetylglucosamine 4,6-dehydratase/5-epimerase